MFEDEDMDMDMDMGIEIRQEASQTHVGFMLASPCNSIPLCAAAIALPFNTTKCLPCEVYEEDRGGGGGGGWSERERQGLKEEKKESL